VKGVELVGREAALERFRSQFPSLEDVLGDWEEQPLPAALEASLDSARLNEQAFQSWLEEVRAHQATALVDDDRDWLEQVSRVVAMLRAVGFALAGALLLAAIFTTASVVRLTAYLYLDEIAVMRLVGATEFYIRGPFYAEGLLQGLLGGLLSVAALNLSQGLLRGQGVGGAELWLPQLVSRPLNVGQQILLVVIGGVAGLLGAVLSLRREKLDPTAEES
jgi:cell division transport system permease protein